MPGRSSTARSPRRTACRCSLSRTLSPAEPSGPLAKVGGIMSSERPATPLDRALGTYLDHLTVERGLSTNTLLSYRRDLRRYLEFLSARGIADPGEVSESDVD